MNQASVLPLTVQIRNRSRSMGLKLLLVCGLALLMTIPSLFVNSVVEERTKRAKDVIEEISRRAIKALRLRLAFMWYFQRKVMPT